MNNQYYIRRSFIKNKLIDEKINEDGYAVIGNIGSILIDKLQNLYKDLHNIKASNGAMFYSIYSKDIEYRKQVHKAISEIMNDVLDVYFERKKFKNSINSFIIKTPGKKSEFALHQDSSIIDESKSSQLSLWIPLQDTSLENGTLCFVPKTHKLFLPYRSVTIKPPYMEYEDEIRKYLMPINLKAGDILAFDYRLVHYSPANITNRNRVVVLCGLFEKNASMEVAYQESSYSEIEIYEQDEDYLLTNIGFNLSCDCRPETGSLRIKIKDDLYKMTKEDFINFAKNNNLVKLENNTLQKLKLDSYTVIDANYKASMREILKDKIEDFIK